VVPPATIADFTLVDATGNHRVGSWRNVTICVVRTDASLQSIDATIGAHKRILANGHSGVLAITIAERGAGIPSPALQRVAAQRAKELASTLLGSVVVVLGEGFWLAATRSVITGINLLVPSFRLSFETDVAKGIAHLAGVAHESLSWQRALSEAVAETRRFDGPAPTRGF
jgi:hypothetical protein